jgi:hypothetical protein
MVGCVGTHGEERGGYDFYRRHSLSCNGFVFRERGYTGINYDELKTDIFELVFEITSEYIDDVYKFATILADRLIEEYKTGDRTIPMHEVAKN